MYGAYTGITGVHRCVYVCMYGYKGISPAHLRSAPGAAHGGVGEHTERFGTAGRREGGRLYCVLRHLGQPVGVPL